MEHTFGEKKYVNLSIHDVTADGVFSGYASLFGEVDLSRDVVEPGAFARSVKKRRETGIRMLFQHDPNEPVGTWQVIREDQTGFMLRAGWQKMSHAPPSCCN